MYLNTLMIRRVLVFGPPVLGLMLLMALAGCSSGGSDSQGKTLVVFAAASLVEAFGEMSGDFKKDHPEVTIILNFAGSQRLRTQLEHGARADVFASADDLQMDRLMETGLLLGQPVTFTTNRMVVIVPVSEAADNPTSPVMTLKDMAADGVKLVVALPEVPAGFYARTVIENIGADPASEPKYAERVLSNIVSMEPNVRSVAQKVALGEADAGIVYWSDAQVEGVAGRVRLLPIPDQANVAASYPVARLRNSAEPELAEAFIDLLRSPQGQNILLKHGFGAMDSGQSPPVNGGRRDSG